MNNQKFEDYTKLNHCYWCGKRYYLGVHQHCWERLKAFALSREESLDIRVAF